MQCSSCGAELKQYISNGKTVYKRCGSCRQKTAPVPIQAEETVIHEAVIEEKAPEITPEPLEEEKTPWFKMPSMKVKDEVFTSDTDGVITFNDGGEVETI